MNNVRTIYADWYGGAIWSSGSGSQLAYQYDHLSNMVIFRNAPKLDNYYLIVSMKETEDGEIKTIEPIQLGGPFWLVPNAYTQLAQNISFQVCCKTESGDFENHSAHFTGVILRSKDHSGEELDVDPSIMFDPYKKWVQDKVVDSVSTYLDEHPEALAVHDKSITEPKLADSLAVKTIKDYVTPQMYGYTDGADLGVYLQAAVDDIESGTIFIPAGSYNMKTSVVLKSNITVMGDPSGETEISHGSELLGTPLFTSSSSKQNDHIHLLYLSFHSSGERTAFTLLFNNTAYFWFKHCQIGTEDGVTSYFHGLRLQLVGNFSSTEAQICNNKIVGELDVWCSDALIENNILWGYNRDGALLLRNGVHAMIRGNQFIGGKNGSIYILSTNTHSCDDASILDNYFDGSYFSIDSNWAIKALTKMVNCRIIGNNFWRQKKGAIYGNLQSCLIQNNCFVDNDAKNKGIPDIWLPMENDVFSNTISGNLFRRDSCFDTSGNWIARTVATKPNIFRFYNNANHAPTLVSGNVNGTQSAYDTIFVEGSASTAVLSDNVGMSVTGGVLTETDFTSAYKTKVDSLWNDYQSAMTALGI